MTYRAPTRDMQFVITELAGLEQVASLPAFQEAEVGPDLLSAVLEEAGKLAGEVLAPLNYPGDQQGARLDADGVKAADGFGAAYAQFIAGGWNGLGAPQEFGGQGLPELLNTPTHEMWNSANMSFALCPMLTAGAIEAIKHHGAPEQQAAYLPKMIEGTWTGTMNLTEPQAGSDLAAVRSKAVPNGDHYLVSGQKIFITWGEHDMAENTIHLVLARLPDAPEGVKGISLFIVPKFLLDADGNPGQLNDVRCVSLEHKLGIHASPTCVMSFGDNGGAVGYLIGQANKGLNYMFTMMNEARLKVGLQGLAISERAYQLALQYAKERVQGRPVGSSKTANDRVPIIHHPDVRRMLLCMKSQIEAMRALAYVAAGHMDLARCHPDAEVRRTNQARLDLLIPVIKGWETELGVELASLGVQVHGGMGFIEETGAAQHLRDARIAPIYEGTNGIQAADLVGRKLAMDKGQAMSALLSEMRATLSALASASGDDLAVIRSELSKALDAQEQATQTVLELMASDPAQGMAASFSYMMLSGYVIGGWLLAKSALIAQQRLAEGNDPDFHSAKIITARFYAEQILVKADGLKQAVLAGGTTVMSLGVDQF